MIVAEPRDLTAQRRKLSPKQGAWLKSHSPQQRLGFSEDSQWHRSPVVTITVQTHVDKLLYLSEPQLSHL